MSLRKGLRALYEAHMKEKRDKYARDAYVWDEGIAIGRTEAVLELLSEFGSTPQDLKEAVQTQKNITVLNSWLKLAAKAESLEDFQRKAGI